MDEFTDVTDEIKAILEFYNIGTRSRVDELNLKSVIIDCPRCSGKARISFDPEKVTTKISGSGIANVIIDLPCEHVFVASIDKDFKVRGLLEIERGIHFETERLDIRYLREKIKILEELHSKLMNEKNQNLQYKVFTELTRLRKAADKIK